MLKAQKAGHAGTLDPLATGVLPIALGEATKTMPFVADNSKSYRFTVQWGVQTTTLDKEGRGLRHLRRAADNRSDHRGAEGLRGRDPAGSPRLLRHQDRRGSVPMIWRARARLRRWWARPVTIHAARVVGADDADHLTAEIDCGKGVYVRSLARDLALSLGTVGHVSALRRTRVGPFSEGMAISLESFAELVHTGAASKALLPVETALDDIPAHAVTAEDAFKLAQGRQVVLLPPAGRSVAGGASQERPPTAPFPPSTKVDWSPCASCRSDGFRRSAFSTSSPGD